MHEITSKTEILRLIKREREKLDAVIHKLSHEQLV